MKKLTSWGEGLAGRILQRRLGNARDRHPWHRLSAARFFLAGGLAAALALSFLGPGGTLEPAEAQTANKYVAIGDSVTTGYSVRGCVPDVNRRHGCETPPDYTTEPYPERLSRFLGGDYLDLNRVGVWGYRFQDIVRDSGRQLDPAKSATRLVTMTLGANDLHFSDVPHWLWQHRTGRTNRHAQEHLELRAQDMRDTFQTLPEPKPKQAKVVVTLYFNPFDSERRNRDCTTLFRITDGILANLNARLRTLAEEFKFEIADLMPVFAGHGAGGPSEWVFGTECDYMAAERAHEEPIWSDDPAARRAIGIRFDPHPNDQGAEAIARTIERVFYFGEQPPPVGAHTLNGVDHGIRRQHYGRGVERRISWTAHPHGTKRVSLWLCHGDPSCNVHPHTEACSQSGTGVKGRLECDAFPVGSGVRAHSRHDTAVEPGGSFCPVPGTDAGNDAPWATYSDGHGICEHVMQDRAA